MTFAEYFRWSLHSKKKTFKKSQAWILKRHFQQPFSVALTINSGTNKLKVSWTAGSLVLTPHMKVSCPEAETGILPPRDGGFVPSVTC